MPPPQATPIEVKRGEHGALLAKTGEGKSWIERNGIMPLFQQVIVVDTKEVDFNDFPPVSVEKAVRLAKTDYSFYVRLPFAADLEYDLPRLKTLCAGLLKRGTKRPPLIIVIDEVTDFADSRKLPDSLRQLIRKGRALGISVWSGTQRPAMLPKDYLANVDHTFYLFMRGYDQEANDDWAPFLAERMPEIPHGSHKSLYEGPDAKVVALEPFPEYDWAERLNAQKKAKKGMDIQ
jgi:hypothetical protein